MTTTPNATELFVIASGDNVARVTGTAATTLRPDQRPCDAPVHQTQHRDTTNVAAEMQGPSP